MDKITPIPELSVPSLTMTPMTKPTWHYKDPGSLAASGIYMESDLENLRDHIMFPAEKNGILNTMARGIRGEPIISQGISLSHLLDETSLQKITENTWNKILGTFISFGNASAGIIEIYFCIRIIKLIIDTMIHGYALHTIYGWSIHLIGALWGSVTNLLLHLAKGTTFQEKNNEPEDSSNTRSNQETTNTHEAETLNTSHLQTYHTPHIILLKEKIILSAMNLFILDYNSLIIIYIYINYFIY